MNKLFEFMLKYDEATLCQIASDYDEFERTGVTGDTTLRQTANAWMKEIKEEGNVALWMDRVAFEAYRMIAYTRTEQLRMIDAAMAEMGL